MKMSKISNHRRDGIANEVLKEDREPARTQIYILNFIEEKDDESDKSGDVTLNESEIKEVLKRFKML